MLKKGDYKRWNLSKERNEGMVKERKKRQVWRESNCNISEDINKKDEER